MLGFNQPMCHHLQNLHEELAKSSGSWSRFHLNFIAGKNDIMENDNFICLLHYCKDSLLLLHGMDTSLNEWTHMKSSKRVEQKRITKEKLLGDWEGKDEIQKTKKTSFETMLNKIWPREHWTSLWKTTTEEEKEGCIPSQDLSHNKIKPDKCRWMKAPWLKLIKTLFAC